MNKNKKATRILFLVGIVTWQSSCSNGRQQDCAKHVTEEIHTGLPVEAAEAALKKCGFTTTMDPKATMDPTKKSLYGDKHVEGYPITERTQVLIKLDSNNRVASVKVTTGLIGP